ncbi:MAG: dehydrogenase [Anaerolineae bacterium UTCFX2]|jgi:2-oxoglutarate dehydrogenase E2 component (dihydrolipoamide succinyltransferase)|nr:2-oxo acid dehydrogenase subunit E2 [Anaerolineae bacterium]MCZ7551436.1 2-oxo acid dehydrogenase subunit E2 [Anaerolineales bacterium]OQY94949.1 MAG: dehydrogenase [Anaerolineae bacterium UTCFX2]
MAIQVIMPLLGESVVEGTLTRWLKAPGETVAEFEPLVEVNTDKVDTEVPSPAAGVLLQVLVPEGTTVQAGTRLAWIGQPGEQPQESSPADAAKSAEPPATAPAAPSVAPAVAAAPVPPPESAIEPPRDRSLGFISPVVARMVSEHGVDLYQIRGTGQGGRITKKDVETYLASRGSAPPPAEQPAVPAPAPQPAAPVFAAGELLTLSPLRKQIAEHMLRSKHTAPHVTTIMEADLGRVVAHRQANKEAFARDGVNLTFTAYFVAASVAALKAFPLVNSSFTEAGIQLHPAINIGVAVSLGDAGLIVPVIKNADSLSLLGIARAVNDLAARARARQLVPDEVQGGTFTITNHGVSGSLFATPIINQPQCAILGVGAIQKRPVVISDQNLGDVIAIRTMAYLGLTFDHRVLDGAIADYFLAKLIDTLQTWS